jgi:hypothetical protein
MEYIKQRLVQLWDQSNDPMLPTQEPARLDRMGITLAGPTVVCGTMLRPGRYIFRTCDPSRKPNHVEIFNADRTQLVAEVTPVLEV